MIHIFQVWIGKIKGLDDSHVTTTREGDGLNHSFSCSSARRVGHNVTTEETRSNRKGNRYLVTILQDICYKRQSWFDVFLAVSLLLRTGTPSNFQKIHQ